MQKKLIASGLAAAIAAVAGVSLLSFSPAPCACESPSVLLLASAGLSTSVPYESSPPPERLEAGMDVNLKDQIVHGGSDPYYFSSCKQENSQKVACRLVTEKSMLLQRGYDIRFDTDSSGIFVKSHVSRFTAWL